MKIVTLLLFFLAAHHAAIACTCVNTKGLSEKEHGKYLKGVKAIFYGEVIAVGEKRSVTYRAGRNFDVSDTLQPITFRVLRTWKGVESAEITVEADAGSSCMFVPPIGTKTMIYAYENKPAKLPLAINYCSTGVFDDEKMKREYGEGRVLEIEKKPEPPPTSLGFWERLWASILSWLA